MEVYHCFIPPSNASVNGGISSEWSSLKYTTIDHLLTLILQEGKGALLVKADIKEVYRMIPWLTTTRC